MCNIEFPHFGASYPDAHCIDGYLWDMDSYEDGVYTIGGYDPCPFCNTEAWLKTVLDNEDFENREEALEWVEKMREKWGAENPFKEPIDGVLYAATCGIKNKEQIEESEKPMNQDELEKEIENAWEKLEKDYSPSALDKTEILVSGLVGEKQFSNIALHFYELGKKDVLKDAVEKEVLQVTKNRIPFLTLRLDAAKYKDGDKVSIIILPKEDKQ